MLHRCVSIASWVAPLVGLALGLGVTPSVRADDPKPNQKVIHLQICLYELREAKEDVRDVKGLTDGERVEILGGLDAGITDLKKLIKSMGFEPDYWKPTDRPVYPDFKHLRHAATSLKSAKDQLKTQDGLDPDLVATGLKDIEKCQRHVEKAMDHLK